MAEEGLDALLTFTPENSCYLTNGFNAGINSLPTIGLILPDQALPILIAASLRKPLSDVLPGDRLVYNYGTSYGEPTAGETWQEALMSAISVQSSKPIFRLGIEDAIPHNYHVALEKLFPKAELVNATELINSCRNLKDDDELENVRKAASIANEGLRSAKAALLDGCTEQGATLNARIAMWEHFIANFSADRNTAFGSQESANFDSFQVWMLSGKRRWLQSDCPSAHKPIDEVVNVLIWAGINGYNVEIEESVCVGNVPAIDREIITHYHETVARILPMIRPGVAINEVYREAQRCYERHGYTPVFRIGHGMGLGPHEHLSLDAKTSKPFAPGMVITVEPNIRIPGKAQTQISRTIIITKGGWEYASAFNGEKSH